MKIIVLQHIRIEDPAAISDLMKKDGCAVTTVELDEGEKIPADLNSFDAMICMGGPMDTWMEKIHPWLTDEKQRIREFAVEKEKPFLGICLGCQLLGEAVGGEVRPSPTPEIGVMDVHIEAVGGDPLFGEMPNRIKALQWHSCEVGGLENNADVALLASSPTTKYQAFRYKSRAYGIQFHIEIRADTVGGWGAIPEYKTALENSLGEGALQEINRLADFYMPEMNRHAAMVYEGFKRLVANG